MNTKEEFKLTNTKSKNPAILGTLEGPCADIINPTRNDRKYDDTLWKKVFNNDIVKEHYAAGGVFGELGHPADRIETDMEKICVCMPKPPVEGKDGLLIGRWDILDTPNGRILKTLVDYGYKVGISSRGGGDVYMGDDGLEHVDEDTYDFQAFDVVILPAVKAARLTAVTESFNGKTLKQSLTESYNNCDEKGKSIMLETLNNIGLTNVIKEEEETGKDETLADENNWVKFIEANPSYNKEFDHEKFGKYFDKNGKLIPELEDEFFKIWKSEIIEEECNNENCTDKSLVENDEVKNDEEVVEDGNSKEPESQTNEVNDIESDVADEDIEELIANLQETLKLKSEADDKVISLQSQLAVSDTKVNELTEELNNYKSLASRLSEKVKTIKYQFNKEIISLKESITSKDKLIESQVKELKALKDAKAEVKETLTEALTSNTNELANITNEVTILKEQLNQVNSDKQEVEQRITQLNEEFTNSKKDSELIIENLKKQVSKSKKIQEKYEKIANDTVSRYIKSKALLLGVKPEDIEDRLNESYTLDDIDNVCNSLQAYSLNISKLPFNVGTTKKIKINESKNEITSKPVNNDDDIDDSLLRMAKI